MRSAINELSEEENSNLLKTQFIDETLLIILKGLNSVSGVTK